ncbi:hypothetical protein JCM17960_20580 [Magnetospira thiophila]
MQRLPLTEREDWRATAAEHGFDFHTFDGDPYWDESACYRFSLAQIEDHLENPATELEQLCFEVVERAIADDEVLLKRNCSPPWVMSVTLPPAGRYRQG